METITKTTLIDCTVEDLFNFHLDTNNIKLITPSHTKVELIDYEERTFEGKIIKLKITRAFIPIKWIVKIEKFEYPHLMVDIALKSPFKYWRHQHIFRELGDKSELKDHIEFTIPFGIFGKLFGWFIKNDIEAMFEYRHIHTKKILENKSCNL